MLYLFCVGGGVWKSNVTPAISFRMCKSSVIATQLGRKFVTLPAINLGGFIK